MIYRDGYVQNDWSSPYVCVHSTVLYNCALPDDGPLRSETCRSLCLLKHYCDSNEVCAFVVYSVTIVSLCTEWKLYNWSDYPLL